MTNIRTKPEGSEPSFYAVLRKTTFRNERADRGQLERPQELDIDLIVKQIQTVLDDEVKGTFEEWVQPYQKDLAQVLELLERYTRNLVHMQQESTLSAHAICQEFHQFHTAIYEWTEKLTSESFLPHPLQRVSEAFAQELTTVPEVVGVPIPPNYWAIHGDDPFPLRIRKQCSRLSIAIKRLVRTIACRIKQAGGADASCFENVHKSVQIHSFLIHYLENPVAEYLTTVWLRFLEFAAKQIYMIHLETRQIKNEFQVLFSLKSSSDHIDAQQVAAASDKLNHHLSTVRALMHELDQYGIETWQQFRADKGEIYRKLANYRYASDIHTLFSMASARQIGRCRAQLDARLNAERKKWKQHFQAEQGEWRASIELSLLQLKILQICTNSRTTIANIIRGQVRPVVSGTANAVADLSAQVHQMKLEDPQTIKTSMDKAKGLLNTLQQESIPLMMDTVIRSQLDSFAEHFSRQIRKTIDIISDEHNIFIKRDLSSPVSKSVTDNTSFLKAVVLDNFHTNFEQGNHLFRDEYQNQIETIIRTISEIDHIAEVALDAALQHLESQLGETELEAARRHVLNWLGQMTEDINELTGQIDNLLSESTSYLLRLTNGLSTQLSTLADTNSEGQFEQYLLMTRATTGEKLWNYRRKFLPTLVALPSIVTEFVTDRLGQVQRNYLRLREMTGLAPDKADAGESLTRFLTETEEHIKMLPYVYQRLFQLAPLRDDRFFSTRKAELDLLSQAYARWQNGLFAATALVGERGSGITTLLNLAKQRIYVDHQIVEMDFLNARSIFTDESLFNFLRAAFRDIDFRAEPGNMDELESAIKALSQPRIVIAEDLQHVFLRTTYGFDALERFLLFIARTYQNLHWVLTCSLYSWDYFEKVVKINEYVQQKIVFEALRQEDIEEIILKRHQASGYQLVFEPTLDIKQSRHFTKLKTEQEQQEYLRTQFFRHLTELAAGNISVAMLFWLRSYKGFSKDKLVLPAAIHFDPSFLYQLPAEELFALAALLQHDILSTEDHALIFHQDMQQSQMLLNRMANKGFLVQQKYGYRIHPFLYRPVVRVLKSDNIIH